MGSPNAVLLDAWEAAAGRPSVDRAPALLGPLGRLPEGTDTAELPVGRCDVLLFELRRSLFGDQLEAVATCPGCAADVEFSVGLDDLTPAAARTITGARTILEEGGYQVECRSPRNADLRALAELGREAELADLLERCVTAAHGPEGTAVSARELPVAIAEAVATSLAERDPGAHVPLGVRCDCGTEWVDELDIRSVLWMEVSDWAARTLDDVQQLAHAYGWSEADVLAMTPWRRNWYLEAAC
jgi:hypothetical protein